MPKRYTKQSLAESLYALREKIGRWPSPSDLTAEMARANTFLRHFGDWDKAINAAKNANASYTIKGIVNLFTTAPIRFKGNNHDGAIASTGVARVRQQMEPVDPPRVVGDHIGKATYEEADDLLDLEVLQSSGPTRSFPEPHPGTFFIVSRSVIYAAMALGRPTDDLLYPRDYERNPDGSITITGLRCIP